MFRRISFIARHEIAYFFRTRETYVWAFAMPVLFMYFIGTITSRFGGTGSSTYTEPIAVVSSQDAGFLADHLIRRLEENGLAVKLAASVEATVDTTQHVVMIPEDFTERVLRGDRAVVDLVSPERGFSEDLIRYRVARAVYMVLADVVVSGPTGQPNDATALARLRESPRAVTVQLQAAAPQAEIPTGFEQAVPGIMIMFTMLSLLTVGTVSLVLERQQGRLQRLATTPISRGDLLVGKWVGRMTLGVLQIAFAMVVGTLLFGVDWGPSLPMVMAVLMVFASLCGWLSMLLGNLATTEGQAIGIGVFVSNVTAALGGLWWPIEMCPAWMQSLAVCLPTGWAMNAMHQLVIFRASPATAIMPLMALLVTTIVLGIIAQRSFRYQH
jgi:ABC-type multidrug transport system permease subunit